MADLAAVPPASFDFEGTGQRLSGMLSLVAWVERARDLSEAVEMAARIDDGLGTALSRNGIPYNNAMWSSDVSSGLEHLLFAVQHDCWQMQRAGMELSAFVQTSKTIHGAGQGKRRA